MLLDLINLFEKKIIETKNIDNKILQTSFELNESVSIKIVKNFTFLEKIDNYDELPSIYHTTKEKKIIADKKAKLEKNPSKFDGEHILISDALYDNKKNIIYLRAKKTKYSVIASFHKLPQNSKLRNKFYKTGVIVPIITNDNYVFLLERKSGKYSSISGLLEAIGKEKKLNDKKIDNTNLDIVTYNAIKELLEEIFISKNSNNLRVNFSIPRINLISFRKDVSDSSYIEFIAPVFTDCNKKYMEHLITNNNAKDKHEHTNNYISLSLKDKNDIRNFLKKDLPGSFLYRPIITASLNFINSKSDKNLPDITSHNIALTINFLESNK